MRGPATCSDPFVRNRPSFSLQIPRARLDRETQGVGPTMSPLILHGIEGAQQTANRQDTACEWTNEVSHRSEVAREKLTELDSMSVPKQHALRILVEQDFPRLLKQLAAQSPK